MNSKDVVRRGYDKVSYAYRDENQEDVFKHDYAAWLAELTPLVPAGSAVLDLGCGCGAPVSQILARSFTVTGVDISTVQIDRARRTIPQAAFVCADMTELDFAAGSFAAIVSFFAVIHVPLEEQRALFAKLHRWLCPGGFLMATVGSREWTGTEPNWLGIPGATMYWSHAGPETYQSWLTELGFVLCQTRFIPEGDAGGGGHTLILAQKNKD